MMFFVDQPNIIKIIRVTPDANGKNTRTRVGTFFKNTLERKLEEKVKFTKAELEEIDNAIETFNRSKQVRRQHYALSFPEIVREVMAYFETDANETEKELIAMAVTEALRKIRKLDRQAPAAA
ncbi:MAG: hypothetical protein ISP90_03465 [Nevskia sp.]|nr:hypothetical protein [Nevskia sp.]